MAKSKKREAPTNVPGAAGRRLKTAAAAHPARRAAQASIFDSPIIGPAIALGVTLVVYLRCFGNAFVYDDHEMIILNPLIGDWSFIWRSFWHDVWWFRPAGAFPKSSYYRPLQDVWLGTQYHLFGLNPVGWHVSIVLVHLAAVFFLYQLALFLTRSRWTATVGATLFGVMPTGVQAAAWPCAIPFPLLAAFGIGSVWMFASRAQAPQRRLLISIVLFVAALLSHEEAVMLPAIMLAYVFIIEDVPGPDYQPLFRGLSGRAIRALGKTAPYFVLAAVYLCVRVAVLGFISRNSRNNHATFGQVAISIPSALAHYATLLIMPWTAGPAHAFTFANTPDSPIFYLPLIGFAALAGAVYLLVHRHPHRRLYCFLIVWILLEIAPVMNLGGLMKVMLVQDRYLYMASAGFTLILADIAAGFVARGGETRQLAIAISITIIALYGVCAWEVQGYYHDEYRLFTKCIQEDPASTLCHGRLGMVLENQHDLTGAEDEFRTVMRLDSGDGAALYNLSRLHAIEGRYGESWDEMTRAFKLLKSVLPPTFYLELADVADRAGHRDAAEAALAQAAADPRTAAASEYIRAVIAVRHGELADAENLLRTLSLRTPNYPQVWTLYGDVLARRNDNQDAVAAYRHAIMLRPRDAELRLSLALNLRALGQDRDAIQQCRTALMIQPDNQQARALMAELQKPVESAPTGLMR